jgi:hypothetical protein
MLPNRVSLEPETVVEAGLAGLAVLIGAVSTGLDFMVDRWYCSCDLPNLSGCVPPTGCGGPLPPASCAR